MPVVIAGFISFLISFSLLGLIPYYYMHQSGDVLSPLADTSTVKSVVLAATSISSPFPTFSPTPSPTIMPSPSASASPRPSPTPKPSPTPSPKASPVTGEQLENWFTTYANKESVNRDQLKKIAICESNLNPNAVNGIYGGMFQFSTSSWISTRRAMNADQNTNLRFNAEEAIRTGAFRLATLGDAAWPNCK